jgi:predicted nucleotidyltransferase component of viral defense system
MTIRKYKQQVALLLEVIPSVDKEDCFALHGGTAINLFVQNMPRLSVDIDLTYVPFEDRETSLANTQAALERIAARVEKTVRNARVELNVRGDKLFCRSEGTDIKIEVNNTMRGILAGAEKRVLCQKAQQDFDAFCHIQTVPLGQLYGGKICAALDRQHPRDLFDIKYMLENEGFSDDIKRGFLLCLLSSDRPLNELLQPKLKDERSTMTNQFEGMTAEPFSYGEYEAVRNKLIKTIHEQLTPDDRAFLLSFKFGEPEWAKYGYAEFEKFPAVQWKLMHVQKLKNEQPERHAELYQALQEKLH